jgi:nitroreductase
MDLETVDKLLTTTRSVRQRLDLTRPVDPAIIERCLEIAVQAPAGGNVCRYHFMVVTDPAKKAAIGDWYAQAFAKVYTAEILAERRKTHARDVASWIYLVDHLRDVPMLIIPCLEGRPEEDISTARLGGFYGNILPAAWSLMLALRARGIGSAWTTLALRHETEIAALLGIPATITPAALLPIAYITGGDLRPAKRVPATERTYWDTWGTHRSPP